MKKIVVSALLAVFLTLTAAPLGVSAAAVGREDWPVFEVVSGENDTKAEVKSADRRQPSAWHTFYIVTIPLGAVCAAGLGSLIFVLKKKKGRSHPKNTFAAISGVLAVAFVFTAVCGTGIFGLAGLLENNYGSIYYYAGAVDSKDPAPDGTLGFTGDLVNRKILSTFDYGVESKYDRVYSDFPHFWNASEPKYNYATMALGSKYSERYEYSYTEEDGDGANVWYVLPAESAADTGEGFYADAEYRLTMNSSDGETNYVDTSLYDKFRFVFKAENQNNPVNLTVIADTRRKEAVDEGDLSPVRYTLGRYTGKSGEKVEITLNTGVIDAEDRPYLSRIIFRTENSHIKYGDANAYQKNSLYYLELYSTAKTVSSGKIIGSAENTGTAVTMKSEYLGSLGYGLLGAYSASGFYDCADKKWKVWFGAGIPENIASDNVYYTETTDPAKGWTKPVRLILNDPTGMLCAANKAPGYGGDPSVVKVNGTYYMFFSGLEKTPSPPNKIYLATSSDGLNYTVYGPVVDVEKMGLGYGAGSPSVVVKDGVWYLYYYTQSPCKEYPDEPTGFVLKTGATPYSFGKARATYGTFGAADIKWMPMLGLWVATDYTEGATQGGYNFDSVRVGFSKDGVNFDFTNEPSSRPVQDYSAKTNHNPGFIGTEVGFGYENMFLTYGVNDFSLRTMDAGLQMDTRMLGYTRVTFGKEG